MDMPQTRAETVERVTKAVTGQPRRVVIRHAVRIDARGILNEAWLTSANGVITATGTGEDGLEQACRNLGLNDRDMHASHCEDVQMIDARGRFITPGYIDLHCHGAWERSFDDGQDGIAVARAGHALHGTTRQVLSLITNPLDVICTNLTHVHEATKQRPDCLGAHLEGPFLSNLHKGAHDSNCLIDPTPAVIDRLLQAGDGCIRQVTIAPELDGAMCAISQLAGAGVIAAIGHTDCDYPTARRGFDAGARILTHVFNAMNGIHHRNPGPIPAAHEDPRVTAELINDGFHVQDPVASMVFDLFAHRIAFITDAMAATDCPDGAYKLGKLDVNVDHAHARLVSNGAIAGSTLTMDSAVRRAIQVLGISPVVAVEAATLTPAKALGFDRTNPVTGVPLGLLAPGYAGDILLQDPHSWRIEAVWCAGRYLS